jgi:uncharacterized membrane protein
VAWETLSRQGRRNVANVVSSEAIEQVMGEPAAAEPIRVFVGLESAPTETERVALALALAELERTGAFDRGLLMVISPTGTGYVNYVATEAAAYLTRGNLASVTMQYSLRPSPLSLDRVAEGRRQYRMLIDAIHNALAWLGLAAARAATVPGAQQWRSPTTFVQTLVDMKNATNVIPGQFEARATTTGPTWPGSSARSTPWKPATTSWPPSSGPCAPPSWTASGCWTRPRPPRTRTVRPAGLSRAPRTRRPGRSRSGGRRRASPAPPGRSR